MPDQGLTPSGHRSAVLGHFDQLPNSLNCDHCLGLRTLSLRGDCCSYSKLLLPAYFKEVDGKAQPIADGGNSVVPLTTPQGHAMAKPSEELRNSSMSSGPSSKRRRGRPLEILSKRGKRSHASSSVAHHLVKSLELQSTPRSSYRGVRERPGVKGCLVEIRPKRWKKTIWLGTYTSLLEAARAYDAGIFYTGKSIPFNFTDSRGSFPKLPEHLSISNTDPVMMKEVTIFVKEQAQIASRRGKAQAQGPHQKFEYAGSRSMILEGEARVGTRSENLESPSRLIHVKEEVIDGGQDQNKARPFEDLDPVRVLFHQGGVPAVEESSWLESPAPGCKISEPAINEEGDSESTSEDSRTPIINPWSDEEEGSTAADSLLKSPTSAYYYSFQGENESLKNETIVSSQPQSWPFRPFELEVIDPSALKDSTCIGKGSSNLFLCNPRIPSFGIDLHEDAMFMPQSLSETSILSWDFDYPSDDLFNANEEVMLWPHQEGNMAG